MQGRPRVAFFSPLPPVPSGISEYSLDLLPELGRYLDLEVFVERPGIGETLARRFPVSEARTFGDKADGFDIPIFQMGNNVHHLYLYPFLKRYPGITVLHDTVLHHFYVEATLAKGDREGYVALMERTYGEPGKRVAIGRIHDRYADRQYFFFPLNAEIALSSRAVVVHNAHAGRALRRTFPGLAVETIAMGIPEAPVPLPSRETARKRLGLPQDGFIVGSFGFVTRIKRLDVLLKALARLKDDLQGLMGLIVGEISPALDLSTEAAALGVADRVRFAGYVEKGAVPDYVAAVDVFVNLRYPTAGETSASLLKLFAWGKPVIASGYQQFWDFPDTVCPKVRPGPNEVADLVDLLRKLSSDDGLRRRIGSQAQAYIREHHGIAGAAARYTDLVCRVLEEGLQPPGLDGRSPWVRLPWRRSRVPGTLRAELSHTGLPDAASPGQSLCLGVKARNVSDTTWLSGFTPYGGYVALGGLLTHPDGNRELMEWVALSHDVGPGRSIDALFPFAAPARPGRYEIVVDLLVAGLTWFHHKGSVPLTFTLEVGAPE